MQDEVGLGMGRGSDGEHLCPPKGGHINSHSSGSLAVDGLWLAGHVRYFGWVSVMRKVNRIGVSGAVFGLFGAAVLSGSAAMAVEPAPTPPPPPLSATEVESHPGADWFAVNSQTGETITSEDIVLPELEEPSGSESGVTPYLIDDPAAWTACFVQHDEDYPLTTLQWYTESGPMLIELQCGYHNSVTNGGTGWHHISAGHEQQWRDRIIQAAGGGTGEGWDDLMAWQIQEAMNAPAINVSRGNGKWCVGAPVLMYDGDAEYVYTFYPTTLFTVDSKIVITSIPSSVYSCTNG